MQKKLNQNDLICDLARLITIDAGSSIEKIISNDYNF